MRSRTYRAVLRQLAKHNADFGEDRQHGKGSYRTVYNDDIDGQRRSYTLPYHGDKANVHPKALKEMIRRFNLPEDFFD